MTQAENRDQYFDILVKYYFIILKCHNILNKAFKKKIFKHGCVAFCLYLISTFQNLTLSSVTCKKGNKINTLFSVFVLTFVGDIFIVEITNLIIRIFLNISSPSAKAIIQTCQLEKITDNRFVLFTFFKLQVQTLR